MEVPSSDKSCQYCFDDVDCRDEMAFLNEQILIE